MKIIKPSFEIIAETPDLLRLIERGGRVCYKSEDKIGPGSDEALIGKLMNFKHESVLEHAVISVMFVTDRGVTHELVRHRMASFSQESTRYCNYSKGKHGGEAKMIEPFFFDVEEEPQDIYLPTIAYDVVEDTGRVSNVHFEELNSARMNAFDVWFLTCLWTEWGYNMLTRVFNCSAQEARSVLPNSLKTEILVTANVREWRHILTLRTSRDAHPQIRQIMVPLANKLAKQYPCLFGEFADREHAAPAEEVLPGER